MLESITIENFQRHESKTVDLRSLITTITGPTDAGKSTILRAIRWAACNMPSGTAFIRNGSEFSRCTLRVDGKDIERFRGASDNLYKLDGKEFRAFAGNVPDEISDFLNVGPINFEGQHDSIFWFSLTAGEVSRQLNSVVDLGIIDSTLSNIRAMVRDRQSVVTLTTDRLAAKQDQLKELNWVEEADKSLKVVEAADELRTSVASRRNAIAGLVETVKRTTAMRDAAAGALAGANTVGQMGQKAGKSASYLERLMCSVSLAKSSAEVLKRGFPDIMNVQSELTVVDMIVVNMGRLRKLVAEIKPQIKIVKRGFPNTVELDGYVDLEGQDKVNRLRSRINVIRGSIYIRDSAKDALVEAESDLACMTGTVCPACGREI